MLLEQGADFTLGPPCKYTPLHCASRFGNVDCIRILLNKGSDINVDGYRFGTPLELATKYSNLDCVFRLLNDGTVSDRSKVSALHLALIDGNEHFAEVLINNGVDISSTSGTVDPYGSIHAAAAGNCVKLLELLLSRGFDVNSINPLDYQPLFFAITHGHSKIADILLKHGANVKGTTRRYIEPLLHRAIKSCNVENVELLIKFGADVDCCYKGFSALHVAIEIPECAILLIDSGANVNAQTDKGKTPLYKAVKKSPLRVIQYLLKKRS